MKNRYGVVAALALACSLILAGCGGKDSIPVKTVEGVIYEYAANRFVEEGLVDNIDDLDGILEVSLKKLSDNKWGGTFTVGDEKSELSAYYSENEIVWGLDDDVDANRIPYKQPQQVKKKSSEAKLDITSTTMYIEKMTEDRIRQEIEDAGADMALYGVRITKQTRENIYEGIVIFSYPVPPPDNESSQKITIVFDPGDWSVSYELED
jgi:hypothetical protein